MALLRHRASERVHPLSTRTLVGRAPTCALRLTERYVSGEHATLRWNGSGWEVKDLGSRNGTFAGAQRLAPGTSVTLGRGTSLAFGDLADPWDLVDDGPPGPHAQHLVHGTLRHAEAGLLALPDAGHLEQVILRDGRGRWVRETPDGEAEPVADGSIVPTSVGDWRVHLPGADEGTLDVGHCLALASLTLRFHVSRDEEHVGLTLVARGREIHLEEREHLYLLLTLARARLADGPLPPPEQGWVDRDRLLKMLATDANALNVAIFRARQQVEAAGVEGAAGIVEVRRGQRRLGVAAVEILQP